jgi:homoserine kinase
MFFHGSSQAVVSGVQVDALHQLGIYKISKENMQIKIEIHGDNITKTIIQKTHFDW